MSKPKSKIRGRLIWGLTTLLCIALLVGGIGWRSIANRHVASWQLMQQVVQIEADGVNENNAQMLGWNLAILGRDDEIRSLDIFPQFELPPLEVDESKLELNIVPWREGVEQIASEHRVVMIMEDHFASKHREMIGATLPIFREADFTHYAAEAIGESQSELAARGYPFSKTGYYTSDPQFGNVLRRALDLNFQVTGYDFRFVTHDGRETYAAEQLAKIIKSDEASKLVVHAGFAHVLKHDTAEGQRWLAAILWEKTGVEPFTIWQWSDMHDAHEYRAIADAVEQLGEFDEPVLLMPPPSMAGGLRDVPRVDAILVHPRDRSAAPDKRTVLFLDQHQRVSGRWLIEQWPVVVAAYKIGEPANAVPLDQVMLREGEQDFSLWIPVSTDYEIVVFDQAGRQTMAVENHGKNLSVGNAKQ